MCFKQFWKRFGCIFTSQTTPETIDTHDIQENITTTTEQTTHEHKLELTIVAQQDINTSVENPDHFSSTLSLSIGTYEVRNVIKQSFHSIEELDMEPGCMSGKNNQVPKAKQNRRVSALL